MGCAPSRCKVGCCKTPTRDQRIQVPSPNRKLIQTDSISTASSDSAQPVPGMFADYQSIDIENTYTHIFTPVGFENELDIDDTVLNIVEKHFASLNMSTRELFKKEIPDLSLEEQFAQYIEHGDNSAVVTDVERHRLGCIKSCETVDTNIEVQILRQLNVEIEQLIFNQVQKITKKEGEIISKHVQDRKILIDDMLIRGNTYVQDYEDVYKKLLEDYIHKLQSLMIQHLEKLYRGIKIDQKNIFTRSQYYMESLTIEAQDARKRLIAKIYSAANVRIRQFFEDVRKNSQGITNQPLGREEFRIINLRVYSTVGENDPQYGCDNIVDRKKYIKAIHDKKSQPKMKRTVYLGHDLTTKIPK